MANFLCAAKFFFLSLHFEFEIKKQTTISAMNKIRVQLHYGCNKNDIDECPAWNNM